MQQIQDRKIADIFNDAFNKKPTNFCLFTNRNNSLKIPFGSELAYCYIDAYQSNRTVQLELITLAVSRGDQHKVYRNPVCFDPPFKVEYSEVDEIDVSFRSHPTSEHVNLVHINYTMKNGNKKGKLFIFCLNQQVIKNRGEVELEQVSTNKAPLQALWHPFVSGFALVLTEDYFDWVRYQDESVERCVAQKISKLNFGEKVVDFRFWPQEEGIRKFIIIAVGQSGNLYFLLCRLNCNLSEQNLSAQEKRILDKIPLFEIQRYHNLPSQFKCCQGIEVVCPLSSDFILLFRKTSATTKNGRTFTLAISSLIEESANIMERNIVSIKGEPQKDVFEIPHNCLINGKFFFWCGDKLNMINLGLHINYLNQLSQQKVTKFPSKQLQAKYLFALPLKNHKFVVLQKTAIKLLRRHETQHRYKFACIAVENMNLQMDLKKASQRLGQIFKDLQGTLEELTQSQRVESVQKSIVELKYLTEEGDEKQVDAVKGAIDEYKSQNLQKLISQKGQLDELFRQASQKSEQFDRQSQEWRVVEDTLNRIQKNEKTIEDLEKQLEEDEQHADKLELLEEMQAYIRSRQFQLEVSLKEKTHKIFQNELTKLQSYRRTIEEVERNLKQLEEN